MNVNNRNSSNIHVDIHVGHMVIDFTSINTPSLIDRESSVVTHMHRNPSEIFGNSTTAKSMQESVHEDEEESQQQNDLLADEAIIRQLISEDSVRDCFKSE